MRQDAREFSTDGEANVDQKIEFCRGHVISRVANEGVW